MKNFRKYGKTPFNVVVVHGGPGAPGEMAPVAKKLSEKFGVLEPLQTKDSINAQVEELKNVIETYATPPVTLIGWSWGAWLGFIVTSKYPRLIKKLILVSSGPFEDKYAKKIMPKRLSRLTVKDREKLISLLDKINNVNQNKKNELFSQIGKLIEKSDSYKPIPHKSNVIQIQYDIYDKVWNEADKLRKSGKLLKMGKKIHCPVVAIHGDYDPHPSEGVKKPLPSILKNFNFILLKHCGHYPWYEKYAKDRFFKKLNGELEQSS